MSSETLERRFGAVGARLKVADGPWRGDPRIDIRSDGRGEYFDLRFAGGEGVVELEVIDVRPRDRHLLLLARIGEVRASSSAATMNGTGSSPRFPRRHGVLPVSSRRRWRSSRRRCAT
jgi:hypothetical protein